MASFASRVVFHRPIADPNRPDVGARLGNHEHADGRDLLGPQDDGNVKGEAEHDRERHPAKRLVVRLFHFVREEHDDQQAEQGERNVADHAPKQWRSGAEPLVLGQHAKQDAQTGQTVHQSAQTVVLANGVAFAPYEIEQDVKHGHRDGGDPFADP